MFFIPKIVFIDKVRLDRVPTAHNLDGATRLLVRLTAIPGVESMNPVPETEPLGDIEVCMFELKLSNPIASTVVDIDVKDFLDKFAPEPEPVPA